MARVYVKHKHILLLIKVSYPVVVCVRGTATLVSSGLTRPLAEAIRGFELGFVVVPFPSVRRGLTPAS